MQGPTLIAGVSAELALTISAGLVLTPAASASPALIAGVSAEVALTISAGLALTPAVSASPALIAAVRGRTDDQCRARTDACGQGEPCTNRGT